MKEVQYVKVRARVVVSGRVIAKSFWAKKGRVTGSRHSYRLVRRDGEPLGLCTEKIETLCLLILDDADIVWEKPAVLNYRYEELELVSTKEN